MLECMQCGAGADELFSAQHVRLYGYPPIGYDTHVGPGIHAYNKPPMGLWIACFLTLITHHFL